MSYTKLYVNGIPVTSKFFASGYQARLGTTYIGALQEQNEAYFQGFIDDVRIWNIARMAWEIKASYNKPLVGVEQGLIAYFPLDEPSLEQDSLGVSSWKLEVRGAVYSDPFGLGRRN